MKKFLITLCAICISVFASAQTETLNWYMDGNTYATTTCESGDDVLLPTAPTKRGYTFKGWLTYQPIEYLESTGTQYIDTGYHPNQDTGIKTKVKINSSNTGEGYLFGSGESSNNRTFECFSWENKIEFNYYDRYVFSPTVKPEDVIIINWNKNIIKYSINNIVQTTIIGTYATFFSPYQMRIFAITRPTSISRPSATGKIKMYYLQIYDNNALVRDFIPVLDYNGTPCMYDKVEQKFYYNQGTGQFIAGPAI